MARQPITVYRLWCGRKRYSPWVRSKNQAFAAGVPHGVTFEDKLRDTIALGPLAWIEVGQRRYARSRTVPIRREG
jgi:hypothetical protein